MLRELQPPEVTTSLVTRRCSRPSRNPVPSLVTTRVVPRTLARRQAPLPLFARMVPRQAHFPLTIRLLVPALHMSCQMMHPVELQNLMRMTRRFPVLLDCPGRTLGNCSASFTQIFNRCCSPDDTNTRKIPWSELKIGKTAWKTRLKQAITQIVQLIMYGLCCR